ncbi:MAG TPA: hypothetical protein VMI74_04840 [Burkholderiales bacterium]|nr:hypothetical protein [Burkholderiales bacterium]
MKNLLYHYPTMEELRALELAAHRARAREITRLIRTGSAGIKGLFDRLAHAAPGGGKVGHA